MDIDILKNKVLQGEQLSTDEAYSLLEAEPAQLYAAAEEITDKWCSKNFDSCSIINAKAGRCPENCKWCAQSAHYHTGCAESEVVGRQECIEAARANKEAGVKRFSLVTSGRSIRGKELDEVCDMLCEIRDNVGIFTCASLGLLGRDELQRIWDSGVRRYHCNLESAPSHFPSLCSTHSIDDKLRTIRIAKELGFEVCSGGIIGMGESARQRVEFALTLREIDPASIPINILCPIPGTPLANQAPLSEQEILTTVAIFRFIHPKKQIRFAGGRAKLSPEAQVQAMRIGINGGIVGDLLTTIGSRVEEDRQTVAKAGYKF